MKNPQIAVTRYEPQNAPNDTMMTEDELFTEPQNMEPLEDFEEDLKVVPQINNPPPYQQPSLDDFYDSELEITRLSFEQSQKGSPTKSQKSVVINEDQVENETDRNMSFNIVNENPKGEILERAYLSIMENQQSLQTVILNQESWIY